MAIVQPLSIDPNGLWSIRQAKAVMEVINPEAETRGIHFEMVDVTTYGMPSARVMLQAFCTRHDWPIMLDAACEMCLRGFGEEWQVH